MRERVRMDEPQDRLIQRNAGRNEDRQHNREPSQLLAAHASQGEGDPERHRRQRVTEVVDQVGKQRDRMREHKNEQLPDRSEPEDEQAERDRLDALPRTDDRTIDETMRVTMTTVAVPMADVRMAVR